MAPVQYRFLGPFLLLAVQSMCQPHIVEETVPDICSVSRCKHGGTCISYGDMYMCKCTPGYAGVMCEKDIDPCSPNPCKNSGACVVSKEDSFVCQCQAGYSGHTCDMSACDKQCSMVYSPVCGSDMFTYISECQLERTICNKPWLKAIDNKPCKSVGCKTLCAPTEKPVCGTDCITYKNECELDNERRCTAHRYPPLTKSYSGDCRAFSCDIRRPYKCSKCLLLTGRVCGSDGKRYKSECHLLIKACSKPDLKLVTCPENSGERPKKNCTIPIDLGNAEVKGWYPGEVVPEGTKLVFSCKNGYAMEGDAKVKCRKGKEISPPKCYANCNEITRFDNGKVNGSSTHGQMYTFWCNNGYSLIGKSSVTCTDGVYSSSIPYCKANCAPVTSFPNGRYSQSNSEYGLGYSFSCDEGYSLNGAANVICLEGVYSPPIPECKADCLELEPLINGGIVIGTSHGQETLFFCNEGYTLVGVSKTRCIDGHYTDSKPTCSAGCDDTVIIENGMYVGSLDHGHSIYITCNIDYSLVGDGIVTCIDGRMNSSLDVCKAVCQLPTSPANGEVSGDTDHGGIITYTCYEGFTIEGTSTTTCVNGNFQEPPPLCRAKCDNSTVVPFGTYTGSLIHGTSIHVTCDQEYTLVGDGEIMCIDGQFNSSLDVCKASCTPFPPANGSVSGDFAHGGQIQFACLTDFTIDGVKVTTCDNGNLIDPVPFCRASCNPISLDNGVTTGNFSHGGRIFFDCNPDYTSDGVLVTTCIDGSLQDPVPTCRASCTPFSPANGSVSGDFAHGGQIQFACLTDFTIDGVKVTTCDNGNLIDPVPFCRAGCDDTVIIENGMYVGSLDHGHSIYITCNIGYSLVGDGIVTCIDGRMNSSLDVCKAVCQLPTSPANGEVSGDTDHGGIITYTCYEGFTIEGTSTTTCVNGNFQEPPPLCRAKCDNSTVVPFGTYTGSLIHGTSIHVTCDQEYTLVGDGEIMCIDGQFNSSLDVCKASCTPFPPANGSVSGDFAHGGQIQFACLTDFTIDGVKVTTCDNGNFIDPVPFCRASCNPISLDNGVITGNFSHGGRIFFDCNPDYTSDGVLVTTCIDGSLQGPVPTCRASCTPFSPANGSVSGDFAHGGQIQFACLTDFTIDGVKVTTCDNGNLIDPVPFCRAICPELQAPKNGSLGTADNIHGGVTTFQCLDGFTLLGAETLRCIDGHYDNEPPTCASGCPAPIPPANGYIEGDDYGHGEVIYFKCDRDYSLDGVKKTKCNDGQYEHEAPVCRKKCPRLKFAHGESQVNRTHLGETTFTCDEGYTLVGVNKTTCINGAYQDESPTCYENCQPPEDIDQGSYTGEFTHGGVITYTCSNGHSLIGNSQRNCSDGSFSGTDPQCRAMCTVIDDFPNGNVTGLPLHNEYMTFSCDEKYTLDGASRILCQDGIYSDSIPQCLENPKRSILKHASCKKLTLEHGTVTGDFTHNSKAHFTCSENYLLVGTHEITCLDGLYASEAPTCHKNCEDPGTPIDGFQTNANFSHGGEVTFGCVTDFTVVGNETTVCKDGSWSNPVPSCSPCRNGENFYNGTCFSQYFERVEIITAKERCKRDGGHLATYTTREELMNVTSSTGSYYAVGIEASGNDWKQVTSETLDFVNWAPYNCVYLSQLRGYRWSNSQRCSENMQFICEYTYEQQISAPCVLDSVNYKSHSYTVKGFGNKLSWREARAACEQNNGQLLVIDDYWEQDAINGFLGECGPYQSDNFWIGLIREDINSEWGWLNNSPLTFNFWPDFQCAFLLDEEDRLWYTSPCDTEQLRYICERGGAVSPRHINPCDTDPCQNGGTCIPKVTETFSDYYCICVSGREGKNCQNAENCNGFICDDGSCIQQLFRCDGTSNCRDDSDERNCASGGRGDAG